MELSAARHDWQRILQSRKGLDSGLGKRHFDLRRLVPVNWKHRLRERRYVEHANAQRNGFVG